MRTHRYAVRLLARAATSPTVSRPVHCPSGRPQAVRSQQTVPRASGPTSDVGRRWLLGCRAKLRRGRRSWPSRGLRVMNPEGPRARMTPPEAMVRMVSVELGEEAADPSSQASHPQKGSPERNAFPWSGSVTARSMPNRDPSVVRWPTSRASAPGAVGVSWWMESCCTSGVGHCRGSTSCVVTMPRVVSTCCQAVRRARGWRTCRGRCSGSTRPQRAAVRRVGIGPGGV